MNIIPLISVKKGQLYDGKDGTYLTIDDLFARVEKDAMLYVLDFDGLEHNNPNFELYQKLTEHCVLWIDDGPRRIDDVMDTIMAGATNLTLRHELWPEMNLPAVFELTDDEVYLSLNPTQHDLLRSFYQDITGIVVFNEEPQRDTDFITASFLKDRAATLNTFLYTAPPNTVGHWEERGVTGILVDLNKKEGYNEWILKQKSS
jgi:hypothetical protein